MRDRFHGEWRRMFFGRVRLRTEAGPDTCHSSQQARRYGAIPPIIHVRMVPVHPTCTSVWCHFTQKRVGRVRLRTEAGPRMCHSPAVAAQVAASPPQRIPA